MNVARRSRPTATDANRFAIRLARELTGRAKILVFNWCYHGSVDETFATLDDGRVVEREGSVGKPVPLEETTRVVEWNDVEALELELIHGDVACVLTEPSLTNVGIVLPEPGFRDALRETTRRTATLLIIDETHTICAGPGGYTAAHGLDPDLITIGKPIAGGIGGTAAGNVFSLAAMRATLEEVLTDEAFERMIRLGERFEAGVAKTIERHALRWHVTRLPGRVPLPPERPRNGREAAAGADPELDRLIHLYLLNRGILMTPFHNMALMSPATTEEQDVDAHTAVFQEAAGELAQAS